MHIKLFTLFFVAIAESWNNRVTTATTTTTTKRQENPKTPKIKQKSNNNKNIYEKDENKKKLCEMEGAKPRNIFYFIVYFCWPKGEKLKSGINLTEQKVP